MVDIKKLIGSQEATGWFAYPGTTWELELAYLPPREMRRIRRLDTEMQDIALLNYTVRGWRGLTPKVLSQVCKVGSTDGINPDAEIPFTREGLEIILESSYGLIGFVLDGVVNHRLFNSPPLVRVEERGG